MTEIILRSPDASKAATIIRSAIDKEITRLGKGAERALAQLKRFENKYQVSSSEFAERFTAEDLEGKDLEYVEWIGEYSLFQQLTEDLVVLENLTYSVSEAHEA
ncbi:MAG: hypothetical protein HC812_11330 [Leptolyngbya sp. RL_3_1]|nr:hypothetical protein [Leptolyngbya sp. RL_3_1]